MSEGEMVEPQHTGAVVVARHRWDTHHADSDREWVRLSSHESSPWITTNDNGSLIAFSWSHLIPREDSTAPSSEDGVNWFRKQYQLAKNRNAQIPPHARMVVTNPTLSAHRRDQ